MATLGLALDVTPQEALVQEVKWTAGHVAWLRDKVQELDTTAGAVTDPDDDDAAAEDAAADTTHGAHPLVWGTTRVKVGGDDAGITQEAKPSVWYELYARERTHLVAVCAAAIRAGVEEREVRLAEAQGNIVIALIREILDGLYRALIAAGITDSALREAWTSAVSEVVPHRVRALAGGTR